MSIIANGSDTSPSARWELGRIVAELRASRGRSHDERRRNGVIIEMPSRKALREIIDGLFAALFPTHFGLADFTEEGVDYFVGHKLDATLRILLHQVERELQFASPASEAPRSPPSL